MLRKRLARERRPVVRYYTSGGGDLTRGREFHAQQLVKAMKACRRYGPRDDQAVKHTRVVTKAIRRFLDRRGVPPERFTPHTWHDPVARVAARRATDDQISAEAARMAHEVFPQFCQTLAELALAEQEGLTGQTLERLVYDALETAAANRSYTPPVDPLRKPPPWKSPSPWKSRRLANEHGAVIREELQ